MIEALNRIYSEKTIEERFGIVPVDGRSIRRIPLPKFIESFTGKAYFVDQAHRALLEGDILGAYFILREDVEKYMREFYRDAEKEDLLPEPWSKKEREGEQSFYDSILQKSIVECPGFALAIFNRKVASVKTAESERYQSR